MQPDPASPSETSSIVWYLQLISGLAILFIIIAGAFGYLALQKLERVAVVAENVNAKVDRAYDVTAPIGKAVLEKGTKTLDALDAEDLGKAANDGVKEIGEAAKNKALDFLRQQGIEKKNAK